MKIVIELSDETYKDIKEENGIYGINNGLSARITGKVVGAIQSGTPLPKEHGRLIDADALDEAIKHREEVAKELEEEAVKGCCDDSEIMDKCLECAKEHRQLAEWLRALKEIWDSGDCNDCLHQNNCTIRPKPGQLARFNCYQYERRIQNDNDNN